MKYTIFHTVRYIINLLIITILSIPTYTYTMNSHTDITSLVFTIFSAVLVDKDWEIIDDQTAVNLRAVTNDLYKKISTHWDTKSIKHGEWLKQLISNHKNQKDTTFYFQKPTLILERDKTEISVTAAMLDTRGDEGFFDRTRSDMNGIYPLIIVPDSVTIGPSGNTLYGIIESKDMPQDHPGIKKKLFGKRVSFKLYQDGSIKGSDMIILNDSNFNQESKPTPGMIYTCQQFNNKKQWILIETDKYHIMTISPTPMRTHYQIIVGGAGSHSVSYTSKMYDSATVWSSPFFSNNRLSQYASIGCNKEQPYLYLEYRFEKGGLQKNCYEHTVLCKNGKSLPLIHLHQELCNYLIECPVSPITTFNHTIEPPIQSLVHTFVPNDVWPVESEEYIEHMQRIYSEQDKQNQQDTWLKAGERCVSKYTSIELARLCQIQIVCTAGNVDPAINNAIIQRITMKRSSNALICSDIFGNYYIDAKGDLKKLYRSQMQRPSNIFEQWARCLIPTGELPSADWKKLTEYLHTRKEEALQVSAEQFLTFFTTQAATYAKNTWDNSCLGAVWCFDEYGMRISVYNLTIHTRHNYIGTYLIQNRFNGAITHIEYNMDGKDPLFYIDNEKVHI